MVENQQGASALKVILITCGGLLLVAILFVVVIFGAASKITSGPSKAADTFMADVGNGDIEKAYYSTSKEFQKEISLSGFKEFLKQYDVMENRKSLSFTYKSSKGDFGVVSGTIVAKDGTKFPITVNVIKDGENWKVLNFSLRPEDVPSGASD